MEQELGKRE